MRARQWRFATGRDASRPDRLEVTWADLVDVGPEERVLLVDPGHRRSEAALRARTAHLAVVTRGDLPSAVGAWDVVCVDDVRLRRDEWRSLLAHLAPGGRVVLVCDNALSPLRLLDRLRGRAHGAAAAAGLGTLLRPLSGQVAPQQVFGLLRSSMSPVTAFDLLSESGVETTVSMSMSHITGLRGALLRAVARTRPGVAARLVPAWLVVAAAAPRAAGGAKVIGKIGNRDSSEIKIVRGDPPREVERHSVNPPRPAELAALRELEAVGFAYSPRLLAVTARGARYSWMDGAPLVPAALDDDRLVAWTARAARMLAELQDLTRRPDGTVLVHGDLWLGNMLVRGEEIVGLIDWSEARRGSPDVDRRFLPVSHQRFHPSDLALDRRLEAVCAEVLPGPVTPEPELCLLGGGADAVQVDVPTTRFAEDPDPEGAAEQLRQVLAWAAGRTTPPVLLPTSRSAARALARHGALLEDRVRTLAPDPEVVLAVTDPASLPGLLRRHGLPVASLTSGPAGDRTDEDSGYHAYVDADGSVVAWFGLGPSVSSSVPEVIASRDVLELGRLVVESLGLCGAVSVDLVRESDGSLSVLRVEPWLGPRHRVGAERGIDLAALWYADLADLPRPRGRSPDLRAPFR